ncbi:MAG TPA: PLP-dependent aminotransferase family protein [Nitrospira sp.]|nr:PLP-dependent aminotransferase family protein [Nitrospira sp.]
MDELFSDRINNVAPSFIREILKVASNPSVTSFAGGLPHRDLFPIVALREATTKVFEDQGADALQYSNTEGFGPLREYIARRYWEKQGLAISMEDILITSGSQQGLDLLGKILVNEGVDVIIEEPAYLGAIQALSLYRARLNTVPISTEGMVVSKLNAVLRRCKPKLMYVVPNFQNPSGITYTRDNREAVAAALRNSPTFLVEDDPYGDLRFVGSRQPSFRHFLPDQTILLGSFSKTVVPAFRLGWIVPPRHLMEKLVIAKQASDLHTNTFVQRVLCQYLCDNDLDTHVKTIVEFYDRQCNTMLAAIGEHFPKEILHTNPEGGMFLWVTLPNKQSSMALLERAIEKNIAFVPGHPFYVGGGGTNTFRLNFSSTGKDAIHRGIALLGKLIREIPA